MHVETRWPCDATELNNDGVIKLGDVYYQTELTLSFFVESGLIDDFSFYSHILSAIDLQFVMFFLSKSFC